MNKNNFMKIWCFTSFQLQQICTLFEIILNRREHAEGYECRLWFNKYYRIAVDIKGCRPTNFDIPTNDPTKLNIRQQAINDSMGTKYNLINHSHRPDRPPLFSSKLNTEKTAPHFKMLINVMNMNKNDM